MILSNSLPAVARRETAGEMRLVRYSLYLLFLRVTIACRHDGGNIPCVKSTSKDLRRTFLKVGPASLNISYCIHSINSGGRARLSAVDASSSSFHDTRSAGT